MILTNLASGIAKTPSAMRGSLSRQQLQSQLADYYTQVIGATHPITSEQYFAQFTDGSRDILRGYVDSVDDMNRASVDGIVAYQNQALTQMTNGATQFLNGLKTLGKNLLLMFAVEFTTLAVDYIAENLKWTPQHKQKIANLANDAISTFNEALEENKSSQSAVLEMANDFQTLAQGVSRTGENMYLTNEQYSTYKSYVEKLITLNPQLVEGFNDQGEAIINNKTAIEETTKALKEQQRLLYSDFFAGDDNENVLENILNEREKLLVERRNIFTSSATNVVGSGGLNNGVAFETDSAQYQLQFIEYYLNKLAETDNEARKIVDEIISKYNIGDQAIVDDAESYARNMVRAYGVIMNTLENAGYGDEASAKALGAQFDTIEQIMSRYDNIGSELNTKSQAFDEYVDKYAKSTKGYWNLTSIQAKLVEQYAEDYGFADRFATDGSNQEEIERQMRFDVDEFIKFVSQLSDETIAKMDEIMTLDKSKLSYRDWKTKVEKLFNEIINDPNYNENILSQDQLKLKLGLSIETDEGQIRTLEQEYEDEIERIVNRFKNNRANFNKDYGLANGTIFAKLRGLTPDQLDILGGLEDLSQFSSWKSIIDYLNAAQKFDIKSYQDTIDEITKDLTKLGEANEKLKKGELDIRVSGATEEVLELLKDFPDLWEYVDFSEDALNFGDLQKGIVELINTRPDQLLKSFESLGNLTDADVVKVTRLKQSLKQLQADALGDPISWLTKNGITEQDYLDYVLDDYDKIITKLQRQKDDLGDINEELEEQKDNLDEIIDQYETAGNTVIKTLDDKISDITDYYDAQIDKLKTENEELERSIELQEKQAALANAQKRKIRVYTETEGYVWRDDASAVKSAQKDLRDTETNIKIAELEKQRDDEIKLWEDYKDAWEDAMNAYSKAHDEAITDGILGSEWRDSVMDRDEDMLNNYEVNYSSFQYNLSENIEKQIKANDKLEKSIDEKIDKYEDDKTAIQDWVKEQDEQNKAYFKLIDEVEITEQSSWDERLKNFEEFKNNFLNIRRQIEDEDISKMYQVTYNGQAVQFHKTQEEANAGLNEYLNSLMNNYNATHNGAGAAYARKQYEKALRIVAPGSYANGGVIDYTGVANVHGSSSSAEVALSSSQGREVYDFIKSGALSKATEAMTQAYNSLIDLLPKPKINNLINPMLNVPNRVGDVANGGQSVVTNAINISFDGANINAESYESFKDYMDRYTNDLFMKIQTGR